MGFFAVELAAILDNHLRASTNEGRPRVWLGFESISAILIALSHAYAIISKIFTRLGLAYSKQVKSSLSLTQFILCTHYDCL